MICAPIVARSMAEARVQFQQASTLPIDLLELRLDYLQEAYDLETLLDECPFPAIVTCRPAREGGRYEDDEEARLDLLTEAARLGAAYVDVEADCVHRYRREGNARVIASYHNFEETPADLPARLREMAALPCDIVKVATHARDLGDNLRLFEAARACGKPFIAMCMGELGEASRILGPKYGSLLTFGSLEKGRESAPGQIPAEDLGLLYRAKYITDETALFAVVGDPIAHSMSPEIHNTAFRSLHLDAVYLRLRVSDFAAFLPVADALNLQGLSVTIPHKHAALEAASEVAELAATIGAVNTLTRRPAGGWHGDNTDCQAALDAIRNAAATVNLELEDAPALLLGSGGTSRALAVGLFDAGCRLTLANRTRAKAEALAADVGAEVVDLADAHKGDYAVVANTTSVGMHPNVGDCPIDPSVFHENQVAFDAVYNPRDTLFLREARHRGAAVADGVEMFVGQAVRQFERWTGHIAPRPAMEEVVVRRLSE